MILENFVILTNSLCQKVLISGNFRISLTIFVLFSYTLCSKLINRTLFDWKVNVLGLKLYLNRRFRNMSMQSFFEKTSLNRLRYLDQALYLFINHVYHVFTSWTSRHSKKAFGKSLREVKQHWKKGHFTINKSLFFNLLSICWAKSSKIKD